MRVNVKKFLFIGPRSEKELFFREAQKAGIVEFIHPTMKRHIPLTETGEKLATAIKVLFGSRISDTQEKRHDLHFAKSIAEKIIAIKEKHDQTADLLSRISQEIEIMRPFGNFSLEDVAFIEEKTKKKIYFYVGKAVKRLSQISEELVLISSLEGIDHFISITEEPVKHKELTQVHITHSLSSLKAQESELSQEMYALDEEIKELTRHNWTLHYALTAEINRADLEFSENASSLTLEETLFVVEGYVPDNKRELLSALASKLHILADEVALEKRDSLPTYLENKGASRVGEDLVNIYDVPSTEDKDPSIWVLGAFSLFFAMIIGDAGYGLIFLLTALYLRFKMQGLKDTGKRFLQLVAILGGASIVWGIFINSYFGIDFGPNSTLRKNSCIEWLLEKKASYHLTQKDDVYESWLQKYPSIAQAQTGKEFLNDGNGKIREKFSDNILMEFSLLVGSLHIILGQFRYIRKNPANIGWIAFMIGAYLYLPVYINATSLLHFVFGIDKVQGGEFGLHLLLGGVALAVIIGLFRNGIFAIFDPLHTVQMFADTMSYLRIYALALAGSIVAATVNEMAGVLPLSIALLLILLGHILNIVLSIMGGVIHGLRLNYIEWYHYSFEGGGKQFRPLQLRIFE